ncbi:hypothetical protein GpartN1_g2912.t1 [Galdieria partita]|uniref:Uncharacterized protein n=1 Tax=Galdieria partita TaxID=83374 RepID=A0A9C7PVE6_9RHOD|nr:hypothetical protein GpartN1_g2912.t1 [Galdieria partita]
MAKSNLSGTHFSSPTRWESPQLHQTQRDSRMKRTRQQTFRKSFLFLIFFCFFVLFRLLFEWKSVVDIFILCTLTGFILQLGSLLIPQTKVDSPSLTRKPVQVSSSPMARNNSPSEDKFPTSFRERDSFSSFSFGLESNPTEYLKPFRRDTSVSSHSPLREENIVYHSSHSPIRHTTSVLPYFHSISPSLSDNAIWLKHRTISGYPITNEDIERCRGWIVQRVIRPFIARIIPFKDSIPYLSSFSEFDQNSFHSIDQLYPLPPVRDAKEEFFYLNRYLCMDSYPSAGEYIFERLLQLSKDYYMSLYSYSDWKLDENTWSLSMNIPSDAEIVLYVVSCFIDEVIQRCSSASNLVSVGPFSKRHIDFSFPSPLIRSHGNESLLYKLGGWKYRSGAVVCYLQRRPPLFALIGQEGKCLSIPMGRTNVFAAIVGLFKLIDEYFDGQLFQVSLDSPYLGMKDGWESSFV